MSFDEIMDIVLDAIKDSALVLPFLFLTYILIEFIQRKSTLFKDGRFLSGKYAPLFASLAGVFPQCGFSVMASKLYDSSIIKMGTLLAVYIATSDEAFALLLTSGNFLDLAFLIGLKIVYALIIGYLVNFFVKKGIQIKYNKTINFKHEEYCRQCGNSSKAKNKWEAYLLYPFLHALKTFLFVLAINLIFGFIIYFVGEANIVDFMENQKILQPVVCALVGLIPNCASSILITQLFIRGGISFGSMFAGLSANAGIGLAIILKNRKKFKQNLILLTILFVASVVAGFILNLVWKF